MAIELSVTEDYLTLLSREVNSYRSKPVALSKLDVFTEAELDRLAAAGIRSTKNLYERAATRSQRAELLRQLDVADDRLLAAVELSNLVRINGVGPAFAHFLRSLGVRGPADVLRTDTGEILRRYTASVTGAPSHPKLRVEDVEYCKRFSVGLSSDIEW